jgi:hypothetical protein
MGDWKTMKHEPPLSDGKWRLYNLANDPGQNLDVSHPDFLESIPEAKDLFSSIAPNTIKQQNDISQNWMATNWNGICDELTKISNPTLVITGTHNNVPTANSLVIAGKIPGAWLI